MDLDDIEETTRMGIYQEAEEAYIGEYSARIDAAYDAARDAEAMRAYEAEKGSLTWIRVGCWKA